MSPLRVAVVGAGISGLAAAQQLLRLAQESHLPIELQVLESSDHAGGVISTGRRDGFMWEEGPDSFITEKPAALEALRSLGLESEVVGTQPGARRSFVQWRGKLHPTPEGFYLLAPTRLWPMALSSLFTWRGKVRMALEAFLPAKEVDDETLGAFVRRRFGREALERMAQPMVAGLYAADPEALSLQSTFPQFIQWERQYGSVLKALRSRRRAGASATRQASGPRYGLFATVSTGLDRWVERWVSALPAGSLRLRSTVEKLEATPQGWALYGEGGARDDFAAVVLALPAHRSAALLQSVDPEMATLLSGIPYADAATLHLAFPRGAIRHALDGFGYVVPEVEESSVSGVTFSHVKFSQRAPQGFALLRVFAARRSLSLKDEELTRRLLEDVRKPLGIEGDPLWTSLKRWPASMPHYVKGHRERVARLEEGLRRWPGLGLAGNGLKGLGLPDCISQGQAAAVRAFQACSSRVAA